MPLYRATIPSTITFRAAASSQPWTSMPSGLTEWNSSISQRTAADLSAATQARLIVQMVNTGAASAELRVQYSLDASTWNYLDGVSGPSAGIAVGNTTVRGAWVTIAAAARTDVYLRIAGINGDGTTSPSFANIFMQVR